MPSKKRLDLAKPIDALQHCFDLEMSGVALYTGLSFRVFGPERVELVRFLREQAQESLLHAQGVGDRMVRLGANPALNAPEDLAENPRTVDDILRISLVHERRAVDGYRAVAAVADDDFALMDYATRMVAEESDHVAEVELMLRPME